MNQLKEEINSIAADDFCDPKLTEWELDSIINLVLNAAVEATEHCVFTSCEHRMIDFRSAYNNGVEDVVEAINKLRGEK